MAKPARARIRVAAALATAALVVLTLGAGPVVVQAVSPEAVPSAITVPIIADPASINPILATDSYGRSIVAMLYPTLATASATGSAKPLLAQSWAVTNKGLTINIVLRSGLDWSDGRPVTARDVVATFTAMANRRDRSPFLALFDAVSDMVATGRYSLTVELSRPDPSLLHPLLLLPIAPASVVAPLVGRPRALRANADLNLSAQVSAGPFRLASWNRQTGTLRFVRNPSYPWGAARLETFTLQYEATADSAWQAFVDGQLGVANVPSDAVSQAAALAKAGKVRLITMPTETYTYVAFNMNDPIWTNGMVREAAVEAVNRRGIERRLAVSPGTLTGGPPPLSLVASNGNMAGLAYNPENARALLETAGWHVGKGGVRYKGGEPLAFTLVTVSGVPLWDHYIAIVAYDLRQVGFEVTVEYQTFASLTASLSRPPGAASPGAWALAWEMTPTSDARTLFGGSAALPPGGQDVGAYEDPTVASALQTLAVDGMASARRQAETALRGALRNDPPAIFLYRETGLVATVPGLRVPMPTVSLGQNLVDPQAWYFTAP
jgi:peptide/nickel transport system substrate-binding protein